MDAVRIHVPDVDAALKFYGEKIGLELLWRKGTSEVGLKLRDSDTEIVLAKDNSTGVEVDLLVDSADRAVKELEAVGGRVREGPFDIAIGRCAVVEDPWGNEFVILDMSKGPLRTDSNKNVV